MSGVSLATLPGFQIDRDRALSPVEEREVDAVRPELRHITAHLVAGSGTLDLDHLCARPGKEQGGQRPRQERTEVEDPHSGKRLHAV